MLNYAIPVIVLTSIWYHLAYTLSHLENDRDVSAYFKKEHRGKKHFPAKLQIKYELGLTDKEWEDEKSPKLQWSAKHK